MSDSFETLPEGWISLPLGEVIQTQKGKKPHDLGEKNSDRTIAYINIKAFEKKIVFEYAPEQEIPYCEKDDILLVWDGARAGLSGRGVKGYVGSTLAKVTSDLVDMNYLYYFMGSIYSYLNTNTKGVGIPHINPTILFEIPFSLPPQNEQTRIVEKLEELLSDLDNGVAELKAAQIKLTQYRQSLLKSAVEGSLTEQWREQNPVTETGEQLLQRILTERRQRWEQQKLAEFKEKNKKPPKDWQKKYPEPVQPDTSDLPELPEGWVWASLGQCFNVKVGATPSRKKPEYWKGTIPWASSGEVQFGRISDTKEKITEDGLKNSSTQINPKGSVLLGMIGEGKTRGQSAILEIDAANNQNSAALWVPETEISSEFVFYWLWSRYESTRKNSSGNNQPALNKSLVEKMPIPISSIGEMEHIGTKLEKEFKASLNKESDIIESLRISDAQRKNFLKEAFSGKLVEQNSDDEPASVLLEKIKAERADLAKQPKPKRPKKKATMNKVTTDNVRSWIVEQNSQFTFEQLCEKFNSDYESIKDIVFDLLQEASPVIEQEFDKKNKYIVFRKVSK